MAIKRLPRRRKTVCFDFDGTLAEYDGWKGEGHVGEPIPEMIEYATLLDFAGYDVVVSTAREKVEPVRAWCEENGVPAIMVTNRKPIAMVYIDDRAVRYQKGMRYSELKTLVASLLADDYVGPDVGDEDTYIQGRLM